MSGVNLIGAICGVGMTTDMRRLPPMKRKRGCGGNSKSLQPHDRIRLSARYARAAADRGNARSAADRDIALTVAGLARWGRKVQHVSRKGLPSWLNVEMVDGEIVIELGQHRDDVSYEMRLAPPVAKLLAQGIFNLLDVKPKKEKPHDP